MISTIEVSTNDRTELVDITLQVRKIVRDSGIDEGSCLIYVPHTTAAVTINENADPTVKRDILMILDRVIPFSGDYHHAEGNSAAHIKSTLVGSSERVIIRNGDLILGRWQGIFFCEFDGPRSRKVMIQLSPA
jgi:secondary thiamine-phosphate synthase enzyme